MGLSVLMLPTLLLALDVTVLHLALPHLAVDLQASGAQQLWILDIYGFMIAGFLVAMGSLGDRIGRRRLLIIGAGAFGVASVAAAYSSSAEMLIATRALLGVAGATLMPSTLSLIRNMFQDPKQRTFAVSLWMMCFSGGAVLGPAVGGILLEYFWWGSVFLLGVPVMALLLVTAPFLLPEHRDAHAEKLDLFSVALSLAAMLSIIYGMKEIAEGGWQFIPLLVTGSGIVVGWAFVKRQLKLRDPLLDLKLFRHKAFSGSLGMMLLGTAAQGGFVLLFVQYLQMVAGMAPLEAGLWMMPLSAGSIVGSLTAPLFIRRMPRTYVIAAGMAVSALAFAMMPAATIDSSMTIPIISSVLLTFGLAPLFVLSTDFVIASAPPEKSGSAASLSETSGELGMALGIAVLGSAATAIYRHRMELPDEIPPAWAEPAGSSLAGAVAIVDRLPEVVAADVLVRAQQSFMTAWQIVGGIGFSVLLGLGILALAVLRPTKDSRKEHFMR